MPSDAQILFEASIPAAERKRVSFYFAEGSHNMDDRGLMSDGEAMLIVSGPQAAVRALFDKRRAGLSSRYPVRGDSL